MREDDYPVNQFAAVHPKSGHRTQSVQGSEVISNVDNVRDRTRAATATTGTLEFDAAAAAGTVVAGATYWLLFKYGVLLMPNPEAAVQMFSP